MLRVLVGSSFVVIGLLTACSSAIPVEDDSALAATGAGARGSGGIGGGSTPTAPTTATGGTDCANNDEGCACTPGGAPVACFTGAPARRGQPGCKDGTRQCLRSGEFATWGACTGEVTTCDAPSSTTPDYMVCASLPTQGKRGYGMCDADQAVVIVNDGTSREMTCCPIGRNVLSPSAADHNIPRTGLCQADEIATGMTDPAAGVLCTKINTQFLKLSAPTKAQYVNGNAPGALGVIAKAYNVSDTCICPEGSVVIGGHTTRDNKCEDQCVSILKK